MKNYATVVAFSLLFLSSFIRPTPDLSVTELPSIKINQRRRVGFKLIISSVLGAGIGLAAIVQSGLFGKLIDCLKSPKKDIQPSPALPETPGFRFFWQVRDQKALAGLERLRPANKNPATLNQYLSNWYPSPFLLDVKDASGSIILTKQKFATVEHYLMFYKIWYFTNNLTTAQQVLSKNHGWEAKNFADQNINNGPNAYHSQKFKIVKDALVAKFSQTPALKTLLMATGDDILAEASNAARNHEWGIGFHALDPNVTDKSKWTGKNKLGNLLMEVRNELKQKTS